MPPQVSVIITSYNIEGYIGRAIASALAQDGVTLEVIVVDDCSRDKTWQIIQSVTDPRVRKIQMTQNSGPSATRNAALDVAQGDWIAVLDGDDTYAPNRLAACLQQAQDSADIVVDNLLVCREADGASFPMFNRLPDELSLSRFIRGNQNFLGGYTLGYLKPLFRRSFLTAHQLRYDPEIRIGEDYLLLAQALASGARCKSLNEAGYHYTVRQGSISHRLQQSDVARIMLCDSKITSRFTLDPESRTAQATRQHNLKNALAYTEAIALLKAGKPHKALVRLLQRPAALRHFWLPVRARLERHLGLAPLQDNVS